MSRILLLFLTCFLLSPVFDAGAATRRTAQSVKKERRTAAGKVEQTRKQMKQNTAETRRQLNRLSSLKAEAGRIAERISALTAEINATDALIAATEDTIAGLERNLTTLRNTYADNLRAMRARRQQMSTLALIFSSSNFTEAYRRYRYMQQFEQWQKDKTRQITSLASEVAIRRDKVKEARAQQAVRLADLNEENAALEVNRSDTEKVVADLKRQGTSLKKALDEQQRQLKALDDELDRIIAEEARKAEEARLAAEAHRKAEEAKKASGGNKKTDSPVTEVQKPASTDKPKITVSTENIALTGSFEANKGKMPSPVAGQYSIVSHFGLNSHPDVSNVKVNNSGIDLQTAEGASARAVFDGEVSSVFRVSGYQNVVMLRHGNYLTVYAGIDKLAVKKGDKVKAGQSLGTIYSDPDDSGRTVLHFEVRRERAKLNPEEWIK